MVSIGANADGAANVAASTATAGKTAAVAVALTASGKPKEKRRNNEKRKEKSRDAARCRRSRETEIFSELAQVLPLKQEDVNQLDKASIMRVAIVYLKIREMLQLFPKIQELTGDFKIDTDDDDDVDEKVAIVKSPNADVNSFDLFDCAEASQLMKQTLDGFLIILTNDGDITYASDNITEYLGIAKIDILGQQIWEYSHQCDHAELREALNIKRNGYADKIKDEHLLEEGLTTDHRDLFVRFKCTLTSRGRSINIKSASYKVIHITGHLVVNTNGDRVLVGIGRPIPHPSNIEIPLGSTTFLTKHSLDMKFAYVDEKMLALFGYKPEDLLEKSLFECHHAADSDSLMSTFKTVLSKGQGETCRYRFLGKCGGYCWIVTQATILYDKLKPQSVVCVNYVISNLENNNEIYSLAQYEANTKKLAENNIYGNCKNESKSIESNKKQQQQQISKQPVEQEPTITSTTTLIITKNNNNNNDNNYLNNNNNNNKNNSEDRDDVIVALKATSVSSTASLTSPSPPPLLTAANVTTTTATIDDIDIVDVVKSEQIPITTTTITTAATKTNHQQKLNKSTIPPIDPNPQSTSLCQNLQNNCSINPTKPPNLLSTKTTSTPTLSSPTPPPIIQATTTKLKLPKSVTASVLRFNVVNNNNHNNTTDNLPTLPSATQNQTQLPTLNAARHAQSVTASVFTPISQLSNKQQQNIAKATNSITATAAIFGQQQQQQQQQSSLMARPEEDIHKGFLQFVEDARRMLKEEPDDLAHLATTSVDACMPLDETTPLFGEMLVGLMPYGSLLPDDINSLDSTTSSSAATTSAISTTATRASPTLTQSNYSNSSNSNSNNASHAGNIHRNTAAANSSLMSSSSSSSSSSPSSSSVTSPAAVKESLIDQFINYREESNDTNCSQHLLSPSVTSKSPEASSLPSLCSPNSLSQEDEFAFMTMNVDDDIDMAMRAPYIPMNPQDDLPLLTDDLMWCGSTAFATEDLPLHKDSDVMTYDVLKHQLQMQQQQQMCNNRNLLSYQMQQHQQELQQQHFNNSLCSSPASTASSLSPSPVNHHHHHQQQQQQNSGVFATDSSELAALLGGSGSGSLSILGNHCGGGNGGTTLVGACSDDSRSAMSPIQSHQQQQQQQHGVLDAEDFRLQQQRQNHLLGQFVGIDCKKEKFDNGVAGGGGGGEGGLCDSIEDAFDQVYNKDSTNLDCWNEYLQINVNDTTSSSAAPTPPPALTPTAQQQQQHIDDLRQQDCKQQHVQLQHLQPAALQQNIIINTATTSAATLHVPLITIQNNSKNILLQQQQQQHLQRSNSKLILNDEMLSANNNSNSNNNNNNKKMATIKLLNAAPTTATIRLADNKQQQQKLVVKAATQQQHGNKRHLSAAATQQLEAKRLKNSNTTTIELQTAPHLLQQLMAPSMQQQQQQQVTTTNANGQKQQSSLQQQQQRNKAAAAAAAVAQRWATATTTLTELKPTTTITVASAAASIQVQQQSNSVLKNLLDIPPPSDVKSISQILAKEEPMLTDDNSMDQATPPLCISPSLTQPLSVSLPSSTAAVLRNYRQNPLIGGIGVLPSPTTTTVDKVTIANIITNYNDDSNPPGLTACDTDSNSDSGIDDISLHEQSNAMSPVKVLKTKKMTELGVPYDNAMSADAFEEAKGLLLKTNLMNAANNGILKNPTELPPPTPPPQKSSENVGSAGGNRKTSISFMDCSNPLLTPFLMDLCNDDYTMNTEEYLEGNDIEHVLSEWTNEMV